MKNLPVRRYNGGNGHAITSQQEFGLLNDRALQENIAALKESRKELEGINKLVKTALDLPSDRKRSIIAKFLNYLVPTSWYESLPNSVMKLMAEENDVLELIETLRRSNVDDLQNCLLKLGESAIIKREELNNFKANLEIAQRENWSAQKLQSHIADQIGIQIYDIVAKLLDMEFNLLTLEEKEARKDDLLANLHSAVVVREQLLEVMSKVIIFNIQLFYQNFI